MSDAENPFDRVAGSWDAVVADMEATAGEYREAGWNVLELHPSDVAAIDRPDRFGLEVLVPDDEFDALEEWIDGGSSFDSYEVFRAEDAGIVFLLTVLKDETNEQAVCCPGYYDATSDGNALRERAGDVGTFYTHVRRLRRDRVVTFSHDDPAPFFPE